MTATQARPTVAPATRLVPRLPEPTSSWPALDGLRGLAVLAVVGHHFGVGGLSGGWIGVDIFFVISGFVVTGTLLRLSERSPRHRPGWWRFLARRAARLYPALIALVVFAAIWSYVQDGRVTEELRWSVGSSLLQAFNLADGYGYADGRAFGHLWAVAVGWQFSLLVPLVVVGLFALPRRRAAAVAVGFAVLEMLLRPLGVAIGIAPARIYVLTWFRLDGLLLGMAIAFAWQSTSLRIRQRLYRWAWPALAVLAAIPVAAPDWFDWQAPSMILIVPLASVASAALVLALVTRAVPRPIRRLLELAPLRWIGERCYSIYLWHYVVGVALIAGGEEAGWQGWALFGRQVLFTAIAAMSSYSFIERPARQWLDARLTPSRP